MRADLKVDVPKYAMTYPADVDASVREWIRENMEPVVDGDGLERCGRRWFAVAGYRACGSILAIYRDDATGEYCAHAGDEWRENEDPSFGIFAADLSYDDVVDQLAIRYDDQRHL